MLFYENGAKIPMVLNIPSNANRKLNPGSGILYHYELVEQTDWKLGVERIPNYPADLNDVTSSRCNQDQCTFELAYTEYATKDRNKAPTGLTLSFLIPKALVSSGFYPQLVRNPELTLKRQGWSIIGSNQSQRLGFYFDVSELGAGEHNWTFEIQMSN